MGGKKSDDVVPHRGDAGDDQRGQHRRGVSERGVRDAVVEFTLGISVGARENHAPETGETGESTSRSAATSEISDETNVVAFFSGELCRVPVSSVRVETIDVVFAHHDRGVSYFSLLRVSENVADSRVYAFSDVFRVEKRRRARVILRFAPVSSRAGDARDDDVLFETIGGREGGESRRFRGVVDGVCDLRAHRRNVSMGYV